MHGKPDANPPVVVAAVIQTTAGTFQVDNAPVVILTINNNIKFL